MPKRERSIESRVKEHRKYREQCRRRIRPSLVLLAIIAGAIVAWGVFLPLNPWLAGGIVAVAAFSLGMEIRGFRYHTRKLRELGCDPDEKRA